MNHDATLGSMKPVHTGGFTLVELLVVMAIFGLLAAVALPYLKDIGKGSAIDSAMRQLVQDLAYARQRAVSDRANVYVVFLPGVASWQFPWAAPIDPRLKQTATNLLDGQYRAYALVATRRAGDQPGRGRFRYITEWRRMPQGVFIPPPVFTPGWSKQVELQNEFNEKIWLGTFAPCQVRFPSTDGIELILPAVGFDPQGRPLATGSNQDVFIPLCQGSIMYRRDANGALVPEEPDMLENPPGNWLTTYTFIRIDRVTGRTRVERPQVK